MIKISQQQAINRWDTLPDNIRAAVFSDYNAELLWRVCENQHLTEDKIQIVATLAGNVLMGFIHSEDFASEIREALNINPEIANAIAVEIDKKIFNPLKSDLKNIYQPIEIEVGEPVAESSGVGSGILDLREKPSFEIVENKIDLSKFAAPQASPVEFRPEARVEEEVKKEEARKEEIKKELQSKAETVEPKEPSFISFESATAPQLQSLPQEEAPLIIHKEEEIRPLAGKWKSLGGMFGFLQKKSEMKEENLVRANLEIGGEEKPEEKKIAAEIKPEQKPEIKVVDYSAPAPSFEQQKPAGDLPENLPIVKEDLAEIRPEIKTGAVEIEAMPEPKIEEPKPQVEAKNNPEETIDLGMFK